MRRRTFPFRLIGLFGAAALLLGVHAASPAAAQENEGGAAPEQAAPQGQAAPGQEAPEQAAPQTDKQKQDEAIAKPDQSGPPAEIIRDLGQLPFPARRMHELLVEAARAGNIEALRPYIGAGDDATMLSLSGLDGDPIEFLKSQSGDAEGNEILAIMLEVLETGFVHLDAGTENDVYVWPYFFAVPLEKLTAPQKVELFTILTSGDLEEMKSFGTYVFYRVGITPQGRWRFFVAGD
jgi:hypothetical protein